MQRAEAAVENLESSSSSGRRSPWRNSINSVPGALPLSLSFLLLDRVIRREKGDGVGKMRSDADIDLAKDMCMCV